MKHGPNETIEPSATGVPATLRIPLLMLAVAVTVLAALLAPGPLSAEDGPLERASMAALFASAGLLVVLLWPERLRTFWHLPALAALLGARELDLDKSLLSSGILKLRTYSGDTPVVEKVIGLIIVALLLYAVWRTIRLGWRPMLSAIRTPPRWGIWLLVGILLAAFAKTIDGLARKLEPLGITVADETSKAAGMVEEGAELVFALCILIAIAQWQRGLPAGGLRR